MEQKIKAYHIANNEINKEKKKKKLNHLKKIIADTPNFKNDNDILYNKISNGVESLVSQLSNSNINQVKINNDIKDSISNISVINDIEDLILSFTNKLSEIENSEIPNRIFIKGALNAVIKLLHVRSEIIRTSQDLLENISDHEIFETVKDVKQNIDLIFHSDMNDVIKISDVIAKKIFNLQELYILEKFKAYINAKREETSSDWIIFALDNTILPAIGKQINTNKQNTTTERNEHLSSPM